MGGVPEAPDTAMLSVAEKFLWVGLSKEQAEELFAHESASASVKPSYGNRWGLRGCPQQARPNMCPWEFVA